MSEGNDARAAEQPERATVRIFGRSLSTEASYECMRVNRDRKIRTSYEFVLGLVMVM
jgi:hypothetical protein